MAETQVNSFCSEKQRNDKLEQAGVRIRVKRASPVKGMPEYFDPLQNQFKQVQEYHERLMEEKQEGYKTLQYVSSVKQIPEVPYFPKDVYNKLTTGKELAADLGIKSSAKHNTDQALEGIYSSNFIADKSIDTYFNTRLEPTGTGDARSKQKPRKHSKHDMSCYIADDNSKSANGAGASKSRVKSKSLGSLHSLDQISSIDMGAQSQTGEVSLQSLHKSPSPVNDNATSLVRAKNYDSVFSDYSAKELSDKQRLQKSLREAKRGNKEILFEHFMKSTDS